jgi:hypothetical protein
VEGEGEGRATWRLHAPMRASLPHDAVSQRFAFEDRQQALRPHGRKSTHGGDPTREATLLTPPAPALSRSPEAPDGPRQLQKDKAREWIERASEASPQREVATGSLHAARNTPAVPGRIRLATYSSSRNTRSRQEQMAAPRRYTDAQRQAMFRLFEAGIGPTEIARLCASGEAGVGPFEIPRKSCEAIVKEMAAAANLRVPTTALEIEGAGMAERFPSRGARIIDAELKRLEAKQNGGKALSEREAERVARLVEVGSKIAKHLRAASTPPRPRASVAASQGAGTGGQDGSALERLAKEMAERESGKEQLSPTRTPQAEDETDVDRAVATRPAVPLEQAVPGVAQAPRTQQEILEARRKASEPLTQSEKAGQAA